MIEATLNLYNCVPESEEVNLQSQKVFLKKYGVVVTPSASHKIQSIKRWLLDKSLNGEQLNSSFHKSWEKVRNSSEAQLLVEQVLHYISTYGFDQFGIYSDNTIFIPSEELSIPETLPIKVITSAPKKDLIERSLELFRSGVALEQSTIYDIFNSLEECGYKLTGEEEVNNKEANILLHDKLGTRPSDPESLFRFIYYKATGGETLVIKNKEAYELIKKNKYALPPLTNQELVQAAKLFNRFKPLWLSIKTANDANRSIVNKIAKLSKSFHVPYRTPALQMVTSKAFDSKELRKECSKANSYQLIKAYNATSLYKANPMNRFYQIRNGKGWIANKIRTLSWNELHNTQQVLKSELKRRLTNKQKVYCPSFIDYALPTSEKKFSGHIPQGTKVCMPVKNNHKYILIGVYWEGSMVDLDLSAESSEEKVGWNTSLRGRDKELLHSGDVTSAPEGAVEWLYAKNIINNYMVKLNLFKGEINHSFKLILAFGDKEDIQGDYVLHPSKVFYQADCKVTSGEMIVGSIVPDDNGISFYLVNQGCGSSAVSSYGERGETIFNNIIDSQENMLRLKDIESLNFVNNPKEADVDLSPQNLTKDKILNLL